MFSRLLHQSYSLLYVVEYYRLVRTLHLPPPKLVLGSNDLLCLVVVPSSQLQVLQPPCIWNPFPLDHLVSDQPPWLDHCSACHCMHYAPNVILWLILLTSSSIRATNLSTHVSHADRNSSSINNQRLYRGLSPFKVGWASKQILNIGANNNVFYRMIFGGTIPSVRIVKIRDSIPKGVILRIFPNTFPTANQCRPSTTA